MRIGSEEAQSRGGDSPECLQVGLPPNPIEQRKPYIPPTLTELTPEAVTAELESSNKEQNDKLAEALRKLAGVARRQGEVTEP